MEDKSDPGHGNTLAAWTTVITVTVATGVGTVFFFFDQPVFVWASALLALLGVAAGYFLRQRGFGSKPKSQSSN